MSETTFSNVPEFIESLQEHSGDLLLCRCCTTPITHHTETITIGISTNYRFTNAANITFPITCYRNAPGCSIAGVPTEEDSWFGGYYWQLANCDECGEHLGWYYQNEKERFFFGLIQDRLTIKKENK